MDTIHEATFVFEYSGDLGDMQEKRLQAMDDNWRQRMLYPGSTYAIIGIGNSEDKIWLTEGFMSDITKVEPLNETPASVSGRITSDTAGVLACALYRESDSEGVKANDGPLLVVYPWEINTTGNEFTAPLQADQYGPGLYRVEIFVRLNRSSVPYAKTSDDISVDLTAEYSAATLYYDTRESMEPALEIAIPTRKGIVTDISTAAEEGYELVPMEDIFENSIYFRNIPVDETSDDRAITEIKLSHDPRPEDGWVSINLGKLTAPASETSNCYLLFQVRQDLNITGSKCSWVRWDRSTIKMAFYVACHYTKMTLARAFQAPIILIWGV